MNKEKHIEEIARIICGMKNCCDECMWNKVYCHDRHHAEEIYNAGYRKHSKNTIDLPCNVGDKVYRNFSGKEVLESFVNQINIYNDGEIRFWMYGHPIGFAYYDIGKTIFFTKEEAEAKIKVCEI